MHTSKTKTRSKSDHLTTHIALPVLFPWQSVVGKFRASRGRGLRAREGYRGRQNKKEADESDRKRRGDKEMIKEEYIKKEGRS